MRVRPQDNWNPTKAQHEDGKAEQQRMVDDILAAMRSKPQRSYKYAPRFRQDAWGRWVEVR